MLRPNDTGIVLVTGTPGSGKSFFLTRLILKAILSWDRPVYTNVPLKVPVIRQYLRVRGSAASPGMLMPLDHQHFARFLERFQSYQAFREEVKASGVPTSSTELERQFEAHTGEPHNYIPYGSYPAVGLNGERITRRVYDRAERFNDRVMSCAPNWLPPSAVVIIDEAHHWYRNPALKGGGPAYKEPPALLTYLTMHRHLGHLFVAATQAPRQISTSFKSNCTLQIAARSGLHDKAAWGFSWASVGLRPLRYEVFPDQADIDTDPPTDVFTYWPQLPMSQAIFRLYRSFTHGGNPRLMARAVEEYKRITKEVSPMKRPTLISRTAAFSWRWSKRLAVIGLVALVVSLYYEATIENPPEALQIEKVTVLPDPVGPEVAAMLAGSVRLADGSRIYKGESNGDWYLMDCDPRNRVAVIGHCRDGHVWVCRGTAPPQRVGSAEQLASRVEQLRAEIETEAARIGASYELSTR